MYLYWFNKKLGHGKSDDLYVFEIEDIYEKPRCFKSEPKLYCVRIDGNVCLNRDDSCFKKSERKTAIQVPIEEGKVMYRVFWLNEYNVEKGEEVIKNYKRQKAEEYRKKYRRYLED